jgi:TonB family protein
MNNTSLIPCKLISTSLLSKSMVLSLAFSLLTHLTTFAFSYNWDMQSHEKTDQPFLVELIDFPVQPEEEQMVKGEDLGEKDGRKAVKKGNGEKNKISNHPAYLSAHSDSPLTTQNEVKKGTNTPSFEGEATVSLDSQDLKYVSYLSKIKRKIEPRWHYPKSAQKVGLQGKLALSFSILRDGHLDRLELLNSSGQSILDEEALNAVRGAAPYFPLPGRLKISRLNIMATFEYRISPYSMSNFSQSSKEGSL